MQIRTNYSMNGVPYENRRRPNDIPQFSTERAEQENESINPYMADVDFNEKAFDMIGPNAPQEVKDAWMEAAKEVNANGLGIKKNGMLSHISQMMVQRLNKQLNGEEMWITSTFWETQQNLQFRQRNRHYIIQTIHWNMSRKAQRFRGLV